MLLFHNLALPLALDPRRFDILALLCPVLPADAGLLDTLAQRHGFCGMQPAQTHRPQTRTRSRAYMLCACEDDSLTMTYLCFAGGLMKLLYTS